MPAVTAVAHPRDHRVVATIVLLLYTRTLVHLSKVAREPASTDVIPDVQGTPSVVSHAGAALLLLVVATAVAGYTKRRA